MSMIGHNQLPQVSVNGLTDTQKDTVKKAVLEMNDSLTRVASERELQKEIINNTFDAVGINKKLLRRMARVYYKSNFKEEQEADNEFVDFYEGVIDPPRD